jgi:hypothetical protein
VEEVVAKGQEVTLLIDLQKILNLNISVDVLTRSIDSGILQRRARRIKELAKIIDGHDAAFDQRQAVIRLICPPTIQEALNQDNQRSHPKSSLPVRTNTTDAAATEK